MIDPATITGFDWDDGNARKNEKHEISTAESEQIFFNASLLLLTDARHNPGEPRYHALGKTDEGRLLHIAFSLRQGGRRIRVISAREMHRKERVIYEQAA